MNENRCEKVRFGFIMGTGKIKAGMKVYGKQRIDRGSWKVHR